MRSNLSEIHKLNTVDHRLHRSNHDGRGRLEHREMFHPIGAAGPSGTTSRWSACIGPWKYRDNAAHRRVNWHVERQSQWGPLVMVAMGSHSCLDRRENTTCPRVYEGALQYSNGTANNLDS